MTEPTKITIAHVSQAIPHGQGCGTSEDGIMFLAPIELLPDDKVIVDPASGQPLGVYRDNRLVWKFEGHYVSGSMVANLTTDVDGLKALLALLGRKS